MWSTRRTEHLKKKENLPPEDCKPAMKRYCESMHRTHLDRSGVVRRVLVSGRGTQVGRGGGFAIG